MKKAWFQTFINSTCAVLLLLAFERFLVVMGRQSFLNLPDPSLGIPLRYTVLIVGGIELAVAVLCLFHRKIYYQICWLVWLSISYTGFRASLFFLHCHVQSTCIGSLTDPLHLSNGIDALFGLAFPFYLAIGSWVIFFQLLTYRKIELTGAEVTRWVKMRCTDCGGRIEFDSQNSGQRHPCPHCQTPIVLRRADNLKMSCVLCGGSIEFPTHAVGTKIECPHCAKPITLLRQR